MPNEWLDVGAEFIGGVADALGDLAVDIEHVGSTAVPGLLAKPIIDIAVAVDREQDLAVIEADLVGAGWIYRGDAGGAGGHVFVLERRPRFRIAHAHVVEHDGRQWRDYLALSSTPRSDPTARDEYSVATIALVERLGSSNAHRAHHRKSDVVRRLLWGDGGDGAERRRAP